MKQIILMELMWFLFAVGASAQNALHQKLLSLFQEAEQCYLTDDYQRMKACKDQYEELLLKYDFMESDSSDVFYAYALKMNGSFNFGLVKGKDHYFDIAEYYYEEALQTFLKLNSDPNVIKIREELAQLYYKVKDYDKALKQLESVFNYYDYHLNDLGITSLEPDYYRALSQMAICNARLGHFDLALQQNGEAQKYFKREKSEFYYETIRREGKILMLQADNLGIDRYKDARKCYERYVDEECASIAQRLDTMSTAHRAQHWLATHRFLYDCYRLGNHAPELLYNLALFSKGYLLAYESNQNTQHVRWEQVRKKLKAKDCAIEFVQYFGRNDEKRMGCLVLHNTGKPQFLDLFSTDSLLSLKLKYPLTVGDSFDASEPAIKDTLYRDSRLLQLIWSPRLLNAIGSAEKVYFAPDGLIHQWAIEYLMPDSQKVCYRLSSTRNLIRRPAPLKMQSALLCGGISFRAAYHPTETDNDYMAYRYLKAQDGLAFSNLPNTKIEVDSIYACRNNPNDLLLEEDAATDERLIHQLRQNDYDIVHITTHGYYIGHIDIHNDLRPLAEDLSLSRCGVVFAGAANTLTDDYYNENNSDALISGSEFAKMDLSQTELVVLKCCQTGQGRLTDDGIYGMQRALKQAGANAMMISLWSIYEYSSAIFLRFFYDEIERQPVGKKDLHTAFLTARKRLMSYEQQFATIDGATLAPKWVTKRYNTPCHTCPLVLIDVF